MAYNGIGDPISILFFGFATLCLGALILNRQSTLSRVQVEPVTGGSDRTGRLLTALSVITGMLIFALVSADILL